MTNKCDVSIESDLCMDDKFASHVWLLFTLLHKNVSHPIMSIIYRNLSVVAQLTNPVPKILSNLTDLVLIYSMPRIKQIPCQPMSGESNVIFQDENVVIFNCQPSLHKISIVTYFVNVLDWDTFGLNLSCTSPQCFQKDFRVPDRVKFSFL